MKTLIGILALAPALLAQPSLMNPASLNAQAPATFKAKFTTTAGDFTVEVTRAWSPNGADRFFNLVKNGFFTDEAFFRVVPGFIVQFGIPADPKVTAAWESASIKDDPWSNHSNAAGTLVFARTGAPNSRGTQFFINLNNNGPSLDPPSQQGFTPFGKVTDGMSVVQKLYSGYGEDVSMGGHGPNQSLVRTQGKAYLDKNFPKLDSIKSATIVEDAAAPAKK